MKTIYVCVDDEGFMRGWSSIPCEGFVQARGDSRALAAAQFCRARLGSDGVLRPLTPEEDDHRRVQRRREAKGAELAAAMELLEAGPVTEANHLDMIEAIRKVLTAK